MKCPRCWAEKAYIRQAKGWREAALGWLALIPMRCHHCYHEFVVSWFVTIGKQVNAPHPPSKQIGRLGGSEIGQITES